MSFAQLDLSSTTEVGLFGSEDSGVGSLCAVVWLGARAQLLEAIRGRTNIEIRKRTENLCRCLYLTALGTSDTTRYQRFLSKWPMRLSST